MRAWVVYEADCETNYNECYFLKESSAKEYLTRQQEAHPSFFDWWFIEEIAIVEE